MTLDDDVTAQIERLRRGRDARLKDIINEALRRGLRDMSSAQKRRPFRTRAFCMGKPLINIEKVSEGLAYLEGERFK